MYIDDLSVGVAMRIGTQATLNVCCLDVGRNIAWYQLQVLNFGDPSTVSLWYI